MNKMLLNILNKDNFKILILVVVVFASRLPQLLSPNLLIDGDEGIVGVMTMDFLKGEGYPYFFASQSYGLTIVEVLFIAFYFLIFGVSAISLKLAMLTLWSIGCVFFYKSLSNLINGPIWLPFIVVLLFILFPSWCVWSMKARGGYVTVFTCFSLILFLITTVKRKHLNFTLVGFLSIVIYQAQPLWLAGLTPIVCYYLFKEYKLKNIMYFMVGIVTSLALFFYIKIEVSHFTKPPIFNAENLSLANILMIPNVVYQNLLGSYHYAEKISFYSIFANILVVLFLILILIILTKLLFSIKNFNLAHVIAISFLSTIGYLIIMKADSPRYLLPLSQLGFLLIAVSLFREKSKKYYKPIMVIPLLLLGIGNVYSFNTYKFENRNEKDMKELISSLKLKEKTHVYFKHGLLEWQVMFYCNKEIIGRSFSKFDRFQDIVKEVDSMLYYFPERVAIVDYYNESQYVASKNDVVINNQFIIREEVNYELLIKEGFSFKYFFTKPN